MRYHQRLVNDLEPRSLDRAVAAGVSAAAAGVPSLWWVGGDSRQGWAAAVPRHVVVLAPRVATVPTATGGWARSAPRGLVVVEPSSARAFPVDEAGLARTGEPQEAFGGWSHLTWAALPNPAAPWW